MKRWVDRAIKKKARSAEFERKALDQRPLGERTMCRLHPTRGEGARRLLASRSESMHRAVATDFKLRGPHYWCGNFSRRDVVPTPMETAPQLGALKQGVMRGRASAGPSGLYQPQLKETP